MLVFRMRQLDTLSYFPLILTVHQGADSKQDIGALASIIFTVE